MSPAAYLGAVNLFTGDVQGGLGPFLSTWLAQAHWSPDRIGLVTTIVGLSTLALNGPAGALADRAGRPRALLALGCGAILAGTLLLFPSRSTIAVLAAQFLAAAGGTMVPPALNSLTLGIVGKGGYPRQQGRNQAFNHSGIIVAALLVAASTRVLGAEAAFIVLGAMACAAIVTVAAVPRTAWNGRRAHGWQEDEPNETRHTHPLRAILTNRRLLLLSAALALFNLGNGSMLSLLGQRLVVDGHDATRWTATYVVVAQLVMVPVALWAGSLADRRGRRRVLVIASAALAARAVLSALVDAPGWLIPAEMLDGLGAGLLGVAVPVVVADLTWGSGRTQTALGVVNTIQGFGGAVSGVVGGWLIHWLGWTGAFLALGCPALAALALALVLEETSSPADTKGADTDCRARPRPTA